MRIIGLLAGVGRLPVEFARAARGMGFTVIAISVVTGTDPELPGAVDKFYQISVGKLGRILATLKAEGVSEVTLLGKVTKELAFNKLVLPDWRLMKLLAGLRNQSDDTFMLAFVRELAAEGIDVLDQTEFLKPLMPMPGVLSRRRPTAAEQADMDFGFGIAKQMGGLDIGQTVVVKNGAVMAVEAIEGTDACIRRGGALGRGGVTVAKTAKPKQDMRFDVPGIGPDTLQAMIEVGAVALVMEAGKTLLIDQERVLTLADQHGITIAAQ
jgi:UDP-2,3-diacylglucosamine hydrolase